MSEIDQQIEAASKAAGAWWAERLSEKHASKKAAFAESVAKHCAAEMKRRGQNPVARLEVDYDPQGPMLDAVREVIDGGCSGSFFSARGILPEKHELVVRLYQMDPKEGYGNWTTPITVERIK